MNTLPLQTACRPRFFSLTDTKKLMGCTMNTDRLSNSISTAFFLTAAGRFFEIPLAHRCPSM
ncbi:hypothetical protein [Megasphaera massiliensis]|uniref:hypothetical protein n=1 Tax=Megasphaera massiliensis TaxID=1232428 RepID=UPI001E5B6800|nr:hypothetical protein [Megasphaera massiliensis]